MVGSEYHPIASNNHAGGYASNLAVTFADQNRYGCRRNSIDDLVTGQGWGGCLGARSGKSGSEKSDRHYDFLGAHKVLLGMWRVIGE
jgi:hypothetical protein